MKKKLWKKESWNELVEKKKLWKKCTCFVIVSVSVKNVIEMSKLKAQLVEVAKELPKLRAHKGYISELMVHGIGPIPGAKKNKYETNPKTINQALLDGQ